VESVLVLEEGDEYAPLLLLELGEVEALEELELMEAEEDWSVTTGVVEVVAVVVVSVAAVLEDLVLLLQPLRANPARIKVNNIECFIGGLSCAPTDRAHVNQFATHLDASESKQKKRMRASAEQKKTFLRRSRV
jgi:hypothetical protein